MKPSIAVALIVVGAIVVLAPTISDYFYRADIVRVMMLPGNVSVHLEGKMEDLYRIGCYGLGGLMILVAIGGSINHRETVA